MKFQLICTTVNMVKFWEIQLSKTEQQWWLKNRRKHDFLRISEFFNCLKVIERSTRGESVFEQMWAAMGGNPLPAEPRLMIVLTAAAASGKCPHAENNPLHRLLMEWPKLMFGPKPRTRVSSVAMQNQRADSWAQILIDHSGAYRNVECGEVNGKGKSYRERAWRAVCVLSRVVLKDGHEPWRTQETLKSFRLPLECPATSTWERETTSSIYTTIGVYQHQHSCIIHAFYRKHLWHACCHKSPW